MRKLPTALLAGAGALLLGGAALAASQQSHVLNVALPDGTVAQIHYEGDVAPKVVVAPAPVRAIDAFTGAPFLLFQGPPLVRVRTAPMVGDLPATQVQSSPFALFGPSIFTDIGRISAMMDAQMQAMMRQVADMQARVAADPGATRRVATGGAATGGAPAGVVQYSYVSTTSSNGCTTSVQWSADGSGAEPRMVKTSAGACEGGKDGGGAAPAKPVKTAAPKAPAPKVAAPKADEAIPGASRT